MTQKDLNMTTVVARISARALIDFITPLPQALIRDRRLFEIQFLVLKKYFNTPLPPALIRDRRLFETPALIRAITVLGDLNLSPSLPCPPTHPPLLQWPVPASNIHGS